MPKAITVTGSPGSSDYRSDINRLQATMAQAGSPAYHTSDARVRTRPSPYGI
jgi:hypothetical protein